MCYDSEKLLTNSDALGNVIQELKKYLKSILDLDVKVTVWKNADALPIFMHNIYDFYEMELLSHVYVLMVKKDQEDSTPAIIEKHRDQVLQKGSGPCIYVHKRISPHNRLRLIQRRISFIIPGNQMYCPELGIDLREHFKSSLQKNKRFISLAAHLLVMYVITGEVKGKLTPTLLAEQLGYSIMSINRAFQELKAADIGYVHKVGRELVWSIEDKKKLWDQAKEKMRSPVMKRTLLKVDLSNRIISGLSALSHYSNLYPPDVEICALSAKEFNNLKLSKEDNSILPEDATVEVEVWRFDPALFQQDGYVDPFSLYLSLREIPDERVEASLNTMLENIKW